MSWYENRSSFLDGRSFNVSDMQYLLAPNTLWSVCSLLTIEIEWLKKSKLCSSFQIRAYPSKRKTFVWHLYNVGPTSSTLGQRCINVIQCFVFAGIIVNTTYSKSFASLHMQSTGTVLVHIGARTLITGPGPSLNTLVPWILPPSTTQSRDNGGIYIYTFYTRQLHYMDKFVLILH